MTNEETTELNGLIEGKPGTPAEELRLLKLTNQLLKEMNGILRRVTYRKKQSQNKLLES